MKKDLTQENQALKKELSRLHATLNNVGSYIFTKDINGCYTYGNQFVLDFFQVSMADFIGKDDSHFFSIDEFSELKQNDEQVLKYGKTVEREEKNTIARTGEVRYYWIVKQPIYDEHGDIIGLSGISTDITERKILARQLEQKQKLLDTVLDNVDAYIYMKDRQHRFLYVNKKTTELFQRQINEIIGRTANELQEFENDFDHMDDKVIQSGQQITGEEEFVDEQGKAHYYWSNKVPLFDNNQEVESYIGFSHEITELIELKKELEHKATIDDLTKLANRRHLFEQAGKAFKQSQRSNYPLSTLILDLDYFKAINDNYGHHTGDLVLIRVAQCIKNTIRAHDIAGRIGGEEFCIILPDTSSEDAKLLAERMRDQIAKLSISLPHMDPQTQQLQDDQTEVPSICLTTSIGIAQNKSGDKSISQLLHRADEALYQAKAKGRNQVCGQ